MKADFIQNRRGQALAAEDMALRELEKHLTRVLDNLDKAGAKHPKKKKYVHHLRVGCRRAQAALSLYADFLPKPQRKRLEKRLKTLRDAARDPRDLDVLIALLAADKTDQNAGVLLKLARKKRGKAQRKLARAAAKAVDRDLGGDIKEFLEDVARRRTGGGMRFGPWARVELRPVARRFFAAAPALASRAKLRELHEFRIQSKYLRYTMEMLEPAFPEMFKKELLLPVADLQERLGEIIDISERRERFSKWLRHAKDEATALHLREHIALDTSRLRQARADFGAWCTPQFLYQLKTSFDTLLAQLTLVAPARAWAAVQPGLGTHLGAARFS